MKFSPTRLILSILFFAQLLSISAQEHEDYEVVMARQRKAYKASFLTEARSPLTATDTTFLDFFPIDEKWSVWAKFIRTPEAVPFEMMTYSGQKRDYVQFGILRFDLNGRAQILHLYQNLRLVKDSTYADHLFLPFKDLTNGESSYGGGRYIDFKQGDIIGGHMLAIDFNTCYNPWCAYSDGFNCPVPPKENHLDFEILAGERNFKGAKKH